MSNPGGVQGKVGEETADQKESRSCMYSDPIYPSDLVGPA